MQCPRCGTKVSTKSNLNRHLRKYCRVQLPKLAMKPKATSPKAMSPPKAESPPKAVSPPKVVSLNKIATPIIPANITINSNSNNTITNNINVNIQVVADNFYQEITKMMGHRQAMQFLTQAASDNDVMAVLKKIFFENIPPERYPIAYNKDTHRYRYLDNHSQLVEQSHSEMVDLLTTKVQNAMLKASSDLITLSIQENNTNDLYEIYEIDKIHHNLLHLSTIKVEQELPVLTGNQDHHWFSLQPLLC